MKQILFFLSFTISLNLHASASDLFRPTGDDILNNCSKFDSNYHPTAKVLSENLKSTVMYSLCLTAVNNTYQAIRGPMIAMRNTDMVCYQNYYHLAEKNDANVLATTINYIRNHPSTSDANLSVIMAVMMNEYYPIPPECKQ